MSMAVNFSEIRGMVIYINYHGTKSFINMLGSIVESEVAGFFLISHIGIAVCFRLGYSRVKEC